MVARADFLNGFADSGLSEDAKTLRNLLCEMFKPSPSPSMGLEGRLREALEAIETACAEASEDNWDGYGARKFQPDSLKHAKIFVSALPRVIPIPEVSVDPDGEFSFTWQRAPRLVFSVSISKDGVLSYAGLFGRNKKAHGTEDFIQTIPKAVTDNLERLFSAEA